MEFRDELTIRKVVAMVRDEVGDATSKVSSRNYLSPRFVYEVSNAYRAKLIHEKIRKRQQLSSFLQQTIACIPLEKVSQNHCPCEPTEPCMFLKTKYPIPVPVKLTTVSTANGKKEYTYVDWNKFQFKLNSSRQWKHDFAYYTMKSVEEGTYIYIYVNKKERFKKHVSVTGVFYNQLEVQKFPHCNGITPRCKSSLEYRFVYDPDHIAALIEMAATYIRKFKQGLGSDKLNDLRDGVTDPPLRLT